MSLFDKPMTQQEYEAAVDSTRAQRMDWWTKARFGMFIHYGPYAVTCLHEWYQGMSGSSAERYEREVTAHFHPKKGCAYEWVRLAKKAGCKYAVLTTRHHDGYSMWDSDANPYNVVRWGGDYDVVAEFVQACRENGLRIGFYHSIADWHNPDCEASAHDLAARLRFIEYQRALLHELMTRYGKIDILWYDMNRPVASPTAMDFVETNRMVRRLQPDIIINPRSGLHEDIDTPEESLKRNGGKWSYWESCMTFNGLSWGYTDSAEVAPYSYSAQQIIRMLMSVAHGSGNLLLNIGPAPDGSVPAEAIAPLTTVGKWLRRHGKVIYGKRDVHDIWVPSGSSTCKGDKIYAVHYVTPKLGYMPVNGINSKVLSVRCLSDGAPRDFEQEGHVLRILGVTPGTDTIANIPAYEITVEHTPAKHKRSIVCVLEEVK